MFDWGFEASLGYFVLRSKLETYVRSSFVRGPFATAVEGAVGFHWYPFGTRQVWISSEIIAIQNCPYTERPLRLLLGPDRPAVPDQFLLRF